MQVLFFIADVQQGYLYGSFLLDEKVPQDRSRKFMYLFWMKIIFVQVDFLPAFFVWKVNASVNRNGGSMI